MTSKTFSQALGEIDERYIGEAIQFKAKKKPRRVWKGLAVAACVCLVAAIALRISVAFWGNQATDSYCEGTQYILSDLSELPADCADLLTFERVDLSTTDLSLYVDEGKEASDPANWYSLLISDSRSDYRMTIYCLFDSEKDADDWKVDMVFTKQATQVTKIAGTTVSIARNPRSLEYDYWYYAIFERNGIVYDVRLQSDNPGDIHTLLEQMLTSPD